MRRGMIVGTVKDDVGLVRFPPAGHRDIQVLPGGGFDEDVGGVGGDALGAVSGDGVAEVDVLGHGVGGQGDAVAEPCAGWADRDRPIAAHGGDGPGLAVADPAVPVPQPPGVTAGYDRVTHARRRPVGAG